MKPFVMLALLGTMLAGCAAIPAEFVVVACSAGPIVVPNHAAEIAQACALQASVIRQ